MTTTLPMQQRMVKAASDSGSGVMMIFGGAPCSQEWVDKIGGDGYSASGAEIVALVDGLMERRREIVSRFHFVDTSIFFYRCCLMEV
jgi:methanogenic corrinoid protein MtbC1